MCVAGGDLEKQAMHCNYTSGAQRCKVVLEKGGLLVQSEFAYEALLQTIDF